MAPTLPGKLSTLGPITQLGYVPKDFNAAIRFWTEKLGVGPFFLWEHVPVDAISYRGDPTRVDFSAAISYWGEMEIELITQHDQSASAYRDWRSDGLHHLMVPVDDIEAAIATCESEGFGLTMDGRGLLGRAEARFAYCDLGESGPARYVEFARKHPPGAPALEMRARIKEQVRNWDGTQALRPLF